MTTRPIDGDTAGDLLRQMQTIRAFETRIESLFKAGEIPGFVHSCASQEAIAVGVCSRLTRADYTTSTHCRHGHAIAKGIALDAIFAELYGKQAGTCRGRGGSRHVANFSIGMLGANDIVGGGFGIAVGAAFAICYQQRPGVAVCFFGDGAANKGTFHEALNFAGVHTLPAVFVCENNRYAQFTDASRTTVVTDISVRAASYGIVGESVDGATQINMAIYRHSGYHVGDAEDYRHRDEVQTNRRQHDPIARFTERVVADGLLADVDAAAVHTTVDAQIAAAHEFAVAAPFPDPADTMRDVFTEGAAR